MFISELLLPGKGVIVRFVDNDKEEIIIEKDSLSIKIDAEVIKSINKRINKNRKQKQQFKEV